MDPEDHVSDERVDALFNYLVEEGALELISIDPKSHEPLYRITPKCKEILPALYDEFRSELNEVIFSLWQKGVIEVRFGVNSESDMVRLGVDGLKKFWAIYDDLTEDEVRFVNRLVDDSIMTEILERNFSDEV